MRVWVVFLASIFRCWSNASSFLSHYSAALMTRHYHYLFWIPYWHLWNLCFYLLFSKNKTWRSVMWNSCYYFNIFVNETLPITEQSMEHYMAISGAFIIVKWRSQERKRTHEQVIKSDLRQLWPVKIVCWIRLGALILAKLKETHSCMRPNIFVSTDLFEIKLVSQEPHT